MGIFLYECMNITVGDLQGYWKPAALGLQTEGAVQATPAPRPQLACLVRPPDRSRIDAGSRIDTVRTPRSPPNHCSQASTQQNRLPLRTHCVPRFQTSSDPKLRSGVKRQHTAQIPRAAVGKWPAARDHGPGQGAIHPGLAGREGTRAPMAPQPVEERTPATSGVAARATGWGWGAQAQGCPPATPGHRAMPLTSSIPRPPAIPDPSRSPGPR